MREACSTPPASTFTEALALSSDVSVKALRLSREPPFETILMSSPDRGRLTRRDRHQTLPPPMFHTHHPVRPKRLYHCTFLSVTGTSKNDYASAEFKSATKPSANGASHSIPLVYSDREDVTMFRDTRSSWCGEAMGQISTVLGTLGPCLHPISGSRRAPFQGRQRYLIQTPLPGGISTMCV